jgi:hypothetical protein
MENTNRKEKLTRKKAKGNLRAKRGNEMKLTSTQSKPSWEFAH